MENELDKCAEVEGGETETAVPAAGRPRKKSLARRILKWVLWSVAGLLAFVLVAALTLPLWINPVGTSLANALVPKYTGTAFNVDRINLNPYTGKLLISGVKLANPDGYAEKDAFTLGSLSADVEVSTLLSDTIHIREITIDSPFASYVFDATGGNNFDRIIATVNENLGPKKKKKKEDEGETKVVIDKITIKNVKAVVGNGRFELASLVVTDFGKPTAAMIKLEDAKLVNPEGFPEPNAFSLKALSIGMETADLSKKPIVFHDIIVDSPCVGIALRNEGWDDNIRTIFKPMLSGKKEKEEKADVAVEGDKKPEKEGPPVQIDKLEITGAKLQIMKLPIPIPLPTFSNIGKDSEEGATAKDVVLMVRDKAIEGVGVMGSLLRKIWDTLKSLDGSMLDTLGPAILKKLGLGSIKEVGEKTIEKAVEMKDKAVEGVKKAGDAIGGLGTSAADKAKDAYNGVKNFLGGEKKE